MKINVKRMFPLLLVLMMCLMILSGVVYADDTVIEKNKNDCSITVTKYASTNGSSSGNNATGENGYTPDPSSGYTPLKGATFKLFKIANEDDVMNYYNGSNTTTYSPTKFSYSESGNSTYDGTIITDIKEGTTNEYGVYKFDNLSIGIYILKEVTAPSQIVAPLADPCLISIPMVNTATSSNNSNAKWMYDVYVYPKNHESSGTVELIKQDQNNHKLQNVVFKLYKKEFQSNDELTTEDWKDVTTTTDNGGASTTLTLKTDADGKITLANLPAGLYGTQYKLVEIYQAGTSPEGYIINRSPLYFKVNKDNTISWNNSSGEKGNCNNTNTGVVGIPTPTTEPKLLITLCNEIPSLIKEVQENGGTTWKTDEQYRLDDEITYRLIAYVPKNVAELDTYEIKDIPQGGITDSGDSSDYTVTYGDTADTCDQDLNADKYTWSTINASGSNGQGFTLTLKDGGKIAIAGKYIQIVYKAHMNASAVIAGNGNGNTATLTYSKFIDGGDDKYTITDEARVYTYQYQITKYKDSVDNANVIANVEFKLLDQTSPERVLQVVKLSEGVYRLAISTDSVTTDTLVTTTDGTILIKGLENGTYYLKETKTINGYNLLSEPFEITVNVTETTTWTPGTGFNVVKTYGSTTYTIPDAKDTSTIINKKGFVLPQTGGMGYLLFCTVGILLIGGGAALIFGGRRKKIR